MLRAKNLWLVDVFVLAVSGTLVPLRSQFSKLSLANRGIQFKSVLCARSLLLYSLNS